MSLPLATVRPADINFGHSAGGHLSASMLATDWKNTAGDVPADLVPAAFAFSGLFDLTPMTQTSMNADLGLDETSARELSPLFWPAPVGKVFNATVGGDVSNEYLRQSRTTTERWGKASVTFHCEVVPGKNHFTIIEPLSDPDSIQVNCIATLCRQDHRGSLAVRIYLAKGMVRRVEAPS